MLSKRDKDIIENLKKFRVMDRDSIADIHFKGLKKPKDSANNVLLRLIREEQIQRSTAFIPYVYFSPETNMKKNSAKLGHFLAILNVYKEMLQHGDFTQFIVEPKYGKKGMAEPDIFCIYRATPFFIEVQNSYFNEKQIQEKLDRYEELFQSGLILQESWQPEREKIFPTVLILSEQRYGIDTKYSFRIIQAPSFSHLLQSLKPKEDPIKQEIQNNSTPGLKMKLN